MSAGRVISEGLRECTADGGRGRLRVGVEWMGRHQVSLYLGGLALGGLVGLTVPGVARPAELVIQPVLALLLYVTFVGVPFGRLGRAVRDGRFLATVLVVNFIVVPALVWPLSRVVADDQVLLAGVLFVLLTPCIDYVIVFAGLAGADHGRLLAATPLLMQIALLPLYLWLFAGRELVTSVEVGPFAEAFVFLIAVPLVAAVLTQMVAARTRAGRSWENAALGSMVPLMVLTLGVVVASQIADVGARAGSLLRVMPVYVVFAAVMLAVGLLAGRIARLDVTGRRAVVFSGVTRNSLVVLPLVLAFPDRFELAALVVVTQTLVELVMMVALVRLVPKLVPG